MKIRKDGNEQLYVGWSQAKDCYKRAWVQHRTGDKDWAGDARGFSHPPERPDHGSCDACSSARRVQGSQAGLAETSPPGTGSVRGRMFGAPDHEPAAVPGDGHLAVAGGLRAMAASSRSPSWTAGSREKLRA